MISLPQREAIIDDLGGLYAAATQARDTLSTALAPDGAGEGIDQGDDLAMLSSQISACLMDVASLQADLESGMSLGEMGLEDDELTAQIEFLVQEVANLAARARGAATRIQERRHTRAHNR